MSWHYSQALVADYSQAICLDGELSVPSSSTSTDDRSSAPVRTIAHFRPSQFGMTLEPSTAQRGEDVLTWYLAGFPAKPIQPRLEAALRRTIYGRKCGASWQRQLPGTYLPRTLRPLRSSAQRRTSTSWVTKPKSFPLARKTWAVTICGKDIGFVHTPTTKANYLAPSMQKWPACQNFTVVFGYISPTIHEHLMGWPIGWSDLKPLATDRFQSWRQQHGAS